MELETVVAFAAAHKQGVLTDGAGGWVMAVATGGLWSLMTVAADRTKRNERAISLYRCGFTIEEIADELRCVPSTIHRALKMAGEPRRRRGRNNFDNEDMELNN